MMKTLSLFSLAFVLAATNPFGQAAGNSTDDLDIWLEAAMKVSPDVFKACPVSCSAVKNTTSSAEWFLFSDATNLESCNKTMLLDMAIHKAAEADTTAQPAIRACTADYNSTIKPAFIPDKERASLCTTANRVIEEASIYTHQHPTGDGSFVTNHLLSALHQITSHLA